MTIDGMALSTERAVVALVLQRGGMGSNNTIASVTQPDLPLWNTIDDDLPRESERRAALPAQIGQREEPITFQWPVSRTVFYR